MSAEQGFLDLSLPRRRALGRDDFLVSDSNSAALAMVDQWMAWPNGQLALTGPEGSGKTHLAHVWMELTGAERIVATALRTDDAPALTAIGAVVVEDIGPHLDDAMETALFHLLNLMRGEGRPILLTSSVTAPELGVSLPDLASRLKGMTRVTLDAPDEELMQDLFVKQFRDRHLIVSKPVVSFLVRRIDRSASAVADVVERLDKASLAAARGISIPLVKETLGL